MIGSSLVRDQGKLLQRQGINCTCDTYSGAALTFIKSQVPNISTEQCQPEYVHLMCGGNDLDNHNEDEVWQAYERLICLAKRCYPYSTVIVNTIPPPPTTHHPPPPPHPHPHPHPPAEKKRSKTVWKIRSLMGTSVRRVKIRTMNLSFVLMCIQTSGADHCLLYAIVKSCES